MEKFKTNSKMTQMIPGFISVLRPSVTLFLQEEYSHGEIVETKDGQREMNMVQIKLCGVTWSII